MKLKINNHDFIVKIMITSKDKSIGMMNKKFTSENQGMLFIMDEGKHYFWMKDCKIPLDIIFIKDNVITKIHHKCEPCHDEDCPNYEGVGNYILELTGGLCDKLKIKEGDKIKF
jgi:uncharacterized membrane protein (UPF0127 family)